MNEEREILNVYKGILDIFQELNNAKDAEEVMRLYTEYLKLQVRLSTNYPSFNENLEGFRYGNCYTYALGLKCPDIFWKKIKSFGVFLMNFDVGFIGTNNSKLAVGINNSETMLIDNFYKDCESLKIDVFDGDWMDFQPRYNGSLILMYKDVHISCTHDFHFVRVNHRGNLSHRECYNGKIQLLRNESEVPNTYKFVRAFEIIKPVIRERKR